MAGKPLTDLAVPASVLMAARGRRVRPVWENELGGVTFEVGAGPERCFVKWTPKTSGIDLTNEVARLNWAVAFTPVPWVLAQGADGWGSWIITEEGALATIVADIGPFIGVGRADRALGLAPAEVDEWQPAVTWLLARARFAVLRCGTGKWLVWELEQAIKIIRPQQLLILVPADEKVYREFRDRAASILPNPLPQLAIRGRVRNRLIAAIHFSPGWRPQAIPL